MNLEWAKQWLEDFDSLEKMMERYAEDVDFEDIIFGEKLRGKAKLREFFRAFGDPKAGKHTFRVDGYSGGPDGGAVEWTWDAEHADDFMGVPATGKKTQTRGVSVLTFQGGRIASQHDYWDAAVFKQLGAISQPVE